MLRRPIIGILLALAFMAAACDSGPGDPVGVEPRTTEPPDPTATSDRPDDPTTTTAATTPPTTTASTPPAELTWTSCGGGECATLDVPLDWSDPGGPTITLALSRIPAARPGERIGSLLVNPGGPGAPGTDFARSLVNRLPGEITDRFDIVGWDPRGVGSSTAVDCDFDQRAAYDTDPSPDDAAERETLHALQQQFAAACGANTGELLAHVGTEETARDLDAIRAAVLGDELLTYVGYSYGTSIGTYYANLFPDRIRAMVLDGAVDPLLPPLELARTQYESFERSLRTILEGCAASPSCAFGDGDPIGAFERLRDQIDAAPLPTSDGERDLGPGAFVNGVLLPTYIPGGGGLLLQALAEAADGDGTTLLFYADTYTSLDRDGQSAQNDAYAAITCRDDAFPAPEAFDALAASLAVSAPLLGPELAYEYQWCSFWAVPPAAPLPSLDAAGAPPILVISTTGDPATPYEWGVTLADTLSSGVLLTHEGDGHTVYGGEDSCVDDVVDAYLIDLVTPPEGTVC